MTFHDELAAFRADYLGKVPAEIARAMAHADLALATSGLRDSALKAGDQTPDFSLADARGNTVQLSALRRQGPVVVSFHRGGWCPYCNLELRALQRILPALAARGASLVAISPQTPDESLSTAQRNALAFALASDVGNVVARHFGIAFDLAVELRPIDRQLGHGLPETNGDDSWLLPVPATYVVAADGRIILSHVDTDYRDRFEPADILDVLDRLVERRAA